MRKRADTSLDQHLHGFWRANGSPRRLIVAVSGGSDSMAVLVAARRLHASGVMVRAVTIDHGLRPESAREAEQVASWARTISIPHETRIWQGAKPVSGLQAAARRARYQLLAEAAADVGAGAIVTGHTEDDQIETFLMRMARGNATGGLAGMAPIRPIAAGAGPVADLWRPFLGVSREVLRAYLGAGGQAFIDDPSNEDERFERVRVRNWLRGEQVCPDEDASSPFKRDDLVSSLRRAQEEAERTRAIEDHLFRQQGGVIYQWGGIGIRLSFLTDPSAKGLTGRLIHAVSGADYPPSPDQIDHLLSHLEEGQCRESMTGYKASLGGVLIEVRPEDLIFYREPAQLIGRAGIAPAADTPMPSGSSLLWDRRFIVTNNGASEVVLAVLGEQQQISQDFQKVPLYPLHLTPGAARAALPALKTSRSEADGNALRRQVYVQPLVRERFFDGVIRF
ncbi:MAG: tRNA lysidine(34) synthetase TilS [Pseudomonadota bacterium]